MSVEKGADSQPGDLPGLRAASLDPWLRTTLPELLAGAEWEAELIAGGRSNLTYRIGVADTSLILRRAPLGGVLHTAHDMAREVSVLRALANTAVPVPKVIALCTDKTVLGVPFYLMQDVAGAIIRTSEQAAELSVAQRVAVGADLSTVLANLHLIEPESVGLGPYGRRTGYASRQLSRWPRQWEEVRTRELPDMDELVRRLRNGIPADSGVAIVHGDYRLDNTIVTLTEQGPGSAIAAVLDWELSTLGDPLADVGLTLVYWHDIGDEERNAINLVRGVTAHPGFPSSAEFAHAYSLKTGFDLANLNYYQALAAMKLAAILEGVHSRYINGHTAGGEEYQGMEEAVPALISRGLTLLSS